MSFFGKLDFNELSEVDRAIYQYMSSNSDKIAFMRVRDIANESHTSASSVMRFIRKLGYSSFTEFRAESKIKDGTVIDQSFGEDISNDKYFPKDIRTKLVQVAELMLPAENIVFFGIGSSGSICEYAARRFAILGFNAFAMTDPTYPLRAKLKNTSDNVIVTLSITGKTNEVIEVANGYRYDGDYTTVAITSDPSSSLANMSEYLLDYNVKVKRMNRHEDLTSQIPCIYLIEALSYEIERLL